MKTIKLLIFCLCFVLPSLSYSQEKSAGKASYYAKRFHGKRTASGEVYSRDSLTCAHRTYPFGTKLLIRNLKNGKKVVVKVNDRGPFSKSRIVDLSYAAAKELGMIASGTLHVQVEEYTDSVEMNIEQPEIETSRQDGIDQK